jgi:hypothetical protein
LIATGIVEPVGAVRDLGDLEARGDFAADADELPVRLEGRQELRQVPESHG